MPYTTWPSAATRANPNTGGSLVAQPLAGALALAGLAPTLANTSSRFVDFTVASAQDPLSLSGTWSNNTQGVGGNTAPTTGTSVRLALNAAGNLMIAQGSSAAQANYEDSFAFLPGVSSGNMRLKATIYRAAGYSPSSNHELELIVGCKTSASYHRWIECLWSVAGNQQSFNQDGNFDSSAFTDISNPINDIGTPQDLDVFVAELYLSANRIRWGRIRSGVTTWAQDITNTTYIVSSLGNGGGVAVFRRAGDADPAKFGFRDFTAEIF